MDGVGYQKIHSGMLECKRSQLRAILKKEQWLLLDQGAIKRSIRGCGNVRAANRGLSRRNNCDYFRMRGLSKDPFREYVCVKISDTRIFLIRAEWSMWLQSKKSFFFSFYTYITFLTSDAYYALIKKFQQQKYN